MTPTVPAERSDLQTPFVVSALRLMDQRRLQLLQQMEDLAVIEAPEP